MMKEREGRRRKDEGRQKGEEGKGGKQRQRWGRGGRKGKEVIETEIDIDR